MVNNLDETSNKPNTPGVTNLQLLLKKEVTRSQFLKISLLGILSIFGFSTIIHMFTGKRPSEHIASTTAPTVTKYGHKIVKS